MKRLLGWCIFAVLCAGTPAFIWPSQSQTLVLEGFGTFVNSLPSATSVNPADLLYLNQGGVSKKVAGSLVVASPGGSSNSVQYNNAGAFGGVTNGTVGQCLTYATPPVWGACGGGGGTQTSIAAGSNITTSGTAANVTVNMVPTTPTGSLQINNAGLLGALTGSSAQLLLAQAGVAAPSFNTLSQDCTITAAGVITCTKTANSAFTALATASTPLTLSLGGTSNNITPFNGGLAVFTSTALGITTMATALVIDGPTGASAYTGTTCNSAMLQLGGAGTAACVNVGAHGVLIGEGTSAFTSVSTTTAGALLLSQNGAADPSWNTLSQDCSITGAGVITCTKTNNVAFTALATASTPLTLSLGGTSAALVPALGGVVTTTSTTMAVTTLTAGLLAVSPTATISSVALPLTMGEGGTSAGLTPNAGGIITTTSTSMAMTTLTTGILIASSTTTIATSNSLVLNTAGAFFSVPVSTTSNLTATTGNFSGNVTATVLSVPGWLTGTGANFNSMTLANNLTGTQGNFTSILTASIFTGTPTGAGMLAFVSPSIAQFELAGTTNAPTPANGWLNWGGEKRTTATLQVINSTGLTPTTLSVNVQAGRTYAVDADLYLNVGAAVGGIQAALTGTYGSAATEYFGYAIDGGNGTVIGAGVINGVKGATLTNAKNGVVASTLLSGTTGYVKISGTVSVNAAGTLLVAIAQNTGSAASPTTLVIGSRLMVHDMP